MKCYKTLTFCSLLTRRAIPDACHAKRHPNVRKCSVPPVVLHFWLGNVLRATTACTFSTSQLLKVFRSWGVLYIFTSTCVSRRNGVHFFDISTSKSGPTLVCFVHFDLETCFALQRCAIFHLSSGQLAPHPILWRAYFWTLRSHKSLDKHLASQLPTFSRTWIFLLTLSLLWSLFFSALLWLFPPLLFHLSVHTVGRSLPS